MLPFLLAGAAPVQTVSATVTPGKTALLCTTGGTYAATWTGSCKDGLAEGLGVAAWTDADNKKVRMEGELVRGEANGTVNMTSGDVTYIGLLQHFTPHGQGFYKFSNGDMYEGELEHGAPNGQGIWQNFDRSRYEGEWVLGRREGQGRATFALGGSYEGHWHNNRFDGLGTIVYAGSGRKYTGQFKDGRAVDAAAAAPRPDGTYRILRREASMGSYIPETVSKNSPFSGVPWAEMSDGQRENFKRAYATLADGDEPPYPVNGLRPLVTAISEMHGTLFDHYGQVRMHVLVGADGKPKSASTIGKVREDVAKFIGRTLMLTTYKPAMCDGKPCEMIFAIAFYLE